MQKTPGVLDRTGGRKIPIRDQSKPGFGIFRKRGPQKARIGYGVNSKKGVLGEMFQTINTDILSDWMRGGRGIFFDPKKFCIMKNLSS